MRRVRTGVADGARGAGAGVGKTYPESGRSCVKSKRSEEARIRSLLGSDRLETQQVALWSRRGDSNPRPSAYKAAALPLSYAVPQTHHSVQAPQSYPCTLCVPTPCPFRDGRSSRARVPPACCSGVRLPDFFGAYRWGHFSRIPRRRAVESPCVSCHSHDTPRQRVVPYRAGVSLFQHPSADSCHLGGRITLCWAAGIPFSRNRLPTP